MRRIACSRPEHQRGAAALIVTMVLFFTMLLVAVFANRNLVFEQRTSANQYRSTQAFEAAEAGLEWALAQLNSNQGIGADCQPDASLAAASFRERYLTYNRATAAFAGATWNQGGTVAPLQPACVRSNTGWTCSCPTNAPPSLVASPGSGTFPAFTLQFLAGAKPGIVRVVATGCTSLAGSCAPGTSSTADATARVEVALGLLSGLGAAPAAPLTTRGQVNAGTAALGVHNPDAASGGIAIHAGGGIVAPQVRVTPPAGADLAGSLVSRDLALARLDPERLFASYFGVDKAGWRAQPVAKQVSCQGDCSAALTDAIGAEVTNPLIWVSGDLRLDAPVTLGTVQRPVVIVVDGAAALGAGVKVHGLLYSNALSWNNTGAGGAYLRGAAISEGDYQGNGTPDLFYDADVLATLKGHTGSFTRVAGSWRDF